MKKLTAMVMVVLMVMGLAVSASAYSGDPMGYTNYNYNYGYDYSYGYNNYNYNYDYGYGYGYGYGYPNVTGIRQSYSDVDYPTSMWFADEAENYGIKFHIPAQNPIIRSDVFAIIGKAGHKAHEDEGRTYSSSYGVPFRDFTWDSSLYEIAGGLYQRGIMLGYKEDNTVRFAKTITRGEFAKVLCLVAKQNGISSPYTSITFEFEDMKETETRPRHWASDYASMCHAMGLMNGVSSTEFAPDELVTYEQCVATLLRLVERAGYSNYAMDVEDVAYGTTTSVDIDFEDYEFGTDIDELTVYGNKTVYVEVGEKIELKVKATPTDIELDNGDIDWTSSKTSYLKFVDDDVDGRYATAEFKAVKEGRVTVTAEVASDEDVYVEFTVVIQDEDEEEDDDEMEVTSIKVNPTEIELGVGESKSITATVYPSNASNKDIIWESHNEAVATVNTTGKITAVGVGNTTITATAKDGSGVVATIDVTVTAEEVVPNDSIAPVVEITGADSITVGKLATLTVKVDEENLANFEITEADLLGLTGGASINKIKKVSNDTYEITLMGVEVSALELCIDAGVATDVAGNVSAESNGVVIFINSGE